MQNNLLTLLSIDSSRLVTQVVIADHVFVPRTMLCAHSAVNPVEIRLLASELLRGAYRYMDNHRNLLPKELLPVFLRRRQQYLNGGQGTFLSHIAPDLSTPSNFSTDNNSDPMILIVQQRVCPSERCWSEDVVTEVQQAMAQQFPDHRQILLRSDDRFGPKACFACDIFFYSLADVLVGEHGAGLTNSMFMKVGGLLVETVGNMDDRMFPLCGYYSAMAGGVGLHHYAYAYLDSERDRVLGANFTAMAEEARWLYDKVKSEGAN
jgi:hypothetical protein